MRCFLLGLQKSGGPATGRGGLAPHTAGPTRSSSRPPGRSHRPFSSEARRLPTREPKRDGSRGCSSGDAATEWVPPWPSPSPASTGRQARHAAQNAGTCVTTACAQAMGQGYVLQAVATTCMHPASQAHRNLLVWPAKPPKAPPHSVKGSHDKSKAPMQKEGGLVGLASREPAVFSPASCMARPGEELSLGTCAGRTNISRRGVMLGPRAGAPAGRNHGVKKSVSSCCTEF